MLYVELYLITKKSKFYHQRVILLPLEKEMVLYLVVGRWSAASAKGLEDRLNRGSSRENVREGKGTREYRGI